MAGQAERLPQQPPIVVGTRVVIGKDRDIATVRYVGSVAGQQGVWVGVEWDDPSRGKHDGSTGGVKYFDVSGSPTAGSFVRAEKVCAGVPLLAALHARYNNEQAEGASSGAAPDRAVYLNAATSGRRVLVELVGEEQVTERQRQTDLLTRSRLVGACVSSVDPDADLQAALPNLEELDLTGNLLWRWDEPARLLRALPGLHTLNLSGNRLRLPAAGGPAPPRLTSLRALVLNGCGVSWKDVCALQAASLPCLRELHVAGNGISSLLEAGAPQQQQRLEASCASASLASASASSAGAAVDASEQPVIPPQLKALHSVEVLGLEDNQISSWWEVLRLAWLPRLKRLHLSGNAIECVRYPVVAGGDRSAAPTATAAAGSTSAGSDHQQPQGQEAAAAVSGPAFPALEALLLGGCKIASWRDVDEINKFPALRELRLSGNPLVADAKSGGRFEVGRWAAGSGGLCRCAREGAHRLLCLMWFHRYGLNCSRMRTYIIAHPLPHPTPRSSPAWVA